MSRRDLLERLIERKNDSRFHDGGRAALEGLELEEFKRALNAALDIVIPAIAANLEDAKRILLNPLLENVKITTKIQSRDNKLVIAYKAVSRFAEMIGINTSGEIWRVINRIINLKKPNGGEYNPEETIRYIEDLVRERTPATTQSRAGVFLPPLIPQPAPPDPFRALPPVPDEAQVRARLQNRILDAYGNYLQTQRAEHFLRDQEIIRGDPLIIFPAADQLAGTHDQVVNSFNSRYENFLGRHNEERKNFIAIRYSRAARHWDFYTVDDSHYSHHSVSGLDDACGCYTLIGIIANSPVLRGLLYDPQSAISQVLENVRISLTQENNPQVNDIMDSLLEALTTLSAAEILAPVVDPIYARLFIKKAAERGMDAVGLDDANREAVIEDIRQGAIDNASMYHALNGLEIAHCESTELDNYIMPIEEFMRSIIVANYVRTLTEVGFFQQDHIITAQRLLNDVIFQNQVIGALNYRYPPAVNLEVGALTLRAHIGLGEVVESEESEESESEESESEESESESEVVPALAPAPLPLPVNHLTAIASLEKFAKSLHELRGYDAFVKKPDEAAAVDKNNKNPAKILNEYRIDGNKIFFKYRGEVEFSPTSIEVEDNNPLIKINGNKVEINQEVYRDVLNRFYRDRENKVPTPIVRAAIAIQAMHHNQQIS